MISTPPVPLLVADPHDWEAKAVLEKFSNPASTFSEENTDYVAMGYMSYPAAAYWLPRLLFYLRNDAPADSFHFESVLQKLANNAWSSHVQDQLSEDEKNNVFKFLEWLGGQPFMVKAPALRTAARAYAMEMWRTAPNILGEL